MTKKQRDTSPPDPIEHEDPITGELTMLVPNARQRIRNVFLDDLGREIPDPRPMAPPIGYTKAPSMIDLVRAQIQREMALHAADRETENFEDAEDFDIPDDPIDPSTPWENEFDPPWSEVKAAIEADRAKREEEAQHPSTPKSEAWVDRPQKEDNSKAAPGGTAAPPSPASNTGK